ncbi:hypothetical protein EPUS_08290 [Endocarpon pusillum Z07020]|uniref:tRNA pseudouridine(55) synthase n=1 Tax=Endocarpon pusillum (strain Z07020 / HMAS-L-300199) TaxID=1263415 RepID=U1GM68_ENDPU|nr:uncharacterized protein EPUS_08290 [Endocarpon pusillum Z07020]ERF73348.1 hypothetical protein EPUS_08290 [Endocarpon pusillum Z07020]
MAESASKILEGVFAINKPLHLSSAQVLRDLQEHFRSSVFFAPLLHWQSKQALQDVNKSRRKRRAAAENIKIGHGGTLDPQATGILVVGVGKGTKQMNSFLGCSKTYETTVLFGRSTDTYDVAGKVTASASHSHVTRALVEEKLASFRGKIKQVPPIYSALKINGMKAYEYARTGKALPRELQSRDLEVEQCEIVEWLEGGTHEYRWPATEASEELKQVATTMMSAAQNEIQGPESLQKRKRSDTMNEDETDNGSIVKKQRTVSRGATLDLGPKSMFGDAESKRKSLIQESSRTSYTLIHEGMTADEKAKLHTHELRPLSSEVCLAPAARIRVTASSGFYVRSFAHDLGMACSSLALMATLFRSRQAEFDVKSALTYQDLENGENVWGPKLQSMLENWNARHPEESRTDRRDMSENFRTPSWEQGGDQGQRADTSMVKKNGAKRTSHRERRNTSSGED